MNKTKMILCVTGGVILVAVLAMVVAYVAAPEFWISAEGELNSWYYPLLVTAPL